MSPNSVSVLFLHLQLTKGNNLILSFQIKHNINYIIHIGRIGLTWLS